MPKALSVILVMGLLFCPGCRNNQTSGEKTGTNPESQMKYDTTLVVSPNGKSLKSAENKNVDNQDYWYYIRSGSGGFYDYGTNTTVYSQVLQCSQKVTTPGIYSKSDAVGPFNTFQNAQQARNSDLDIAMRGGREIAQRNAICNTRWD